MRPETKQLLRNIGIGLGVFLLVGLLLFGVWKGTRAEMVTIQAVEVSGGETISHQAVQAEVERLLEGEYAGFIPRCFTWTYPQSEIEAAVLETPRVKDPVITRTGRVIKVMFAEYEPVALWCGAYEQGACVFLDEFGYGFAEAPILEGGAFTRYAKVGQPAETGAVFTDTTDFAELRTLVRTLRTLGWPVASIELDQARDAFIQLAGGGELKVSLTLTASQTIDNLQTVLTAEKYSELAPGAFTYIDLRFGNKVFVNEFGDPETHATSTLPTMENATSSDEAAE